MNEGFQFLCRNNCCRFKDQKLSISNKIVSTREFELFLLPKIIRWLLDRLKDYSDTGSQLALHRLYIKSCFLPKNSFLNYGQKLVFSEYCASLPLRFIIMFRLRNFYTYSYFIQSLCDKMTFAVWTFSTWCSSNRAQQILYQDHHKSVDYSSIATTAFASKSDYPKNELKIRENWGENVA